MCYKNEYQKRAHGEVERIFRELLPEAGLHVREEQIRLCHEMLDALMKNEITLCDAGVGIGKTYAYLTACILMRKYSVLHSGYSGCDRRPVVVSTSSIALQKAIIEEYVPFLSDVLLKADLLQGELKAVVRKGKEHFVCDYRLAQRLEAVRDKNKNQAQMEALKSLRHNFDLDSVHNLSGFDRRLVCVPKFCPRECPGKAGCRYQKYLDVSKKEEVFIQICNHNYLLFIFNIYTFIYHIYLYSSYISFHITTCNLLPIILFKVQCLINIYLCRIQIITIKIFISKIVININ